MNWLAHVFLSELDIDFQIGNYLTDSLKAKPWEGSSENIKRGMQTHVLIDSYTDSHEIVKISKKRLREKGLLKSIVIDITYDYFLTKNWDKFSNIPFEEFTNNFYFNAKNSLSALPEDIKPLVKRVIDYHILNNYKDLDDLKLAFERFDRRLSTRLISRDSASSYFEAVQNNIEKLEDDFLIFFPDLLKEVSLKTNSNKTKHFIS